MTRQEGNGTCFAFSPVVFDVNKDIVYAAHPTPFYFTEDELEKYIDLHCLQRFITTVVIGALHFNHKFAKSGDGTRHG